MGGLETFTLLTMGTMGVARIGCGKAVIVGASKAPDVEVAALGLQALVHSSIVTKFPVIGLLLTLSLIHI